MFAGIIAIASDGIVSIDDERQRIVLFNDGAEKIFGYTRDEVIGKPVDILIPERFRARHAREVRAFATGPVCARGIRAREAELFGLRKNGEEFPIQAAISNLELEGHRLLTIMLRDVTLERRLQREALKSLEQEKFLARIGEIFGSSLDERETLEFVARESVKFMADFLIVDLVDGGLLRRVKVAHADPGTEDLARAFESTSPLFHPPPVWSAMQTMQPQLMETVSPELMRRYVPVAELRSLLEAMGPASAMFVPLVARGEAIGVVTFISSRAERRYDASDLSLAEEMARRAALALENARLYRVAHAAIEARDEILGVVAHDLRNPLSAVRLRAGHVLKQLPPEARAKVEDSLRGIVRSADRAARLIEDLLEARSAQVGRLALRREDASATGLILDVAETQRPMISSANITLDLDLEDALPSIWVDRDRVVQVFENLVGNAVKFTPSGGRITIGGRPDANCVRFWVSDTGRGMSRDEAAHVFERFWKGKDADQRGFGLGLAIAKQVVEAHGGTIWVESEPGCGTTFAFTIPTSRPGVSRPELDLARPSDAHLH
jgi:PAS domain S-box-containing protein